MKLAIFGGAGGTGVHLVRQALKAGHSVNALVRPDSTIELDNPNLTIISGDIQNASDVAATLEGTEAVISVLNSAPGNPDHALQKGLRNIVDAMQENNLQRIVMSTGTGTPDAKDKPTLKNKLLIGLVKLVAGKKFKDIVSAVSVVRHSDLDWTIVRVSMPTNKPATGTIRAVENLGEDIGTNITRADLATFMLEETVNPKYLHKSPVVSN